VSSERRSRELTYCAPARAYVKKSHPCIELFGSLDEAQSALGLAVSLAPKGEEELVKRLKKVEEVLFKLGYAAAGLGRLDPSDVLELRRIYEEISPSLPRGFVAHSSGPASASIALARALVRRLERSLVKAAESGLELPDYELLLEAADEMSKALFALEVAAAKLEGGPEPAPKA